MASAIRPLLKAGNPTHLPVSPGQQLTLQDTIYSLKSSRHGSPTPERFEASQDKEIASYYLTVQGFLYGLRRPVSPSCRPPEVNQAPKPHSSASASLEDMLFVDTVARVSDPGLLDPPESTVSDVDSDQVLSPAPDARRLRSPDPKGADGGDVLMKIPRVIRTYTRKIKHEPFVRKDISTKSQTQSFTPQGALLDGLLDDGSDSPTEQLASRENLNIRPAEKRNPRVAMKRKKQSLQNDKGLRRGGCSEADADVETSERNKKTKRKNRRAPVNQLALVARLPSPDGFNVKSPSYLDLSLRQIYC